MIVKINGVLQRFCTPQRLFIRRDYLQPLSKHEFRKGCSRLKIELEYLFINQATVHAPKTKIDHL